MLFKQIGIFMLNIFIIIIQSQIILRNINTYFTLKIAKCKYAQILRND